jgi:hypothetical protein
MSAVQHTVVDAHTLSSKKLEISMVRQSFHCRHQEAQVGIFAFYQGISQAETGGRRAGICWLRPIP